MEITNIEFNMTLQTIIENRNREVLKITTEKARAEKALTKQEEKALKKAEEKYQREVETIRASTAVEKAAKISVFDEAEYQANSKYVADAARGLLSNLSMDKESLEERSLTSEMPVERREEISAFLKLREQAQTSQQLEFVETAKNVARISEQEEKAVRALSENGKPKVVTTYIIPSKSEVYVLSPANAHKNTGLVYALSKKVFDVLLLGEVDLEKQAIGFEVTDSDLNGFSAYVLRPRKESEIPRLAEQLTTKLNELQPQEFKQTGLEHRAEMIGPELLGNEIIDYMINNPELTTLTKVQEVGSIHTPQKKKALSYEEAARLIGKTKASLYCAVNRGRIKKTSEGIDVDSLMAYVAPAKSSVTEAQAPKVTTGKDLVYLGPKKKDSILERVYARYEAFASRGKAKASLGELGEILGSKYPSTVIRIMQSPSMQQYRTREGRNVYVSTEGIKYLLDASRVSSDGKLIRPRGF